MASIGGPGMPPGMPGGGAPPGGPPGGAPGGINPQMIMQLMQKLQPPAAGGEPQQLHQVKLQLGQLASRVGTRNYKAAQLLFAALQDIEKAEQELKESFNQPMQPLNMGAPPGMAPMGGAGGMGGGPMGPGGA